MRNVTVNRHINRRVFAYETRTPACRPQFIIALAMVVLFAAGVM